jgi:uncharacterized protein
MPAVVLLGPRQVGQTTLARQIGTEWHAKAVYLDLVRPVDQRRLADAHAFLRGQTGKLVIIDEIHRAPELFGTLRGIIDDRCAGGERTGHFLLLGSTTIDLVRHVSDTLADHVEGIELRPLDAIELPRSIGDRNRLWIRGGFPESVLAADDTESLRWRRAFIRSYLERDVPMFARRLPAETIGRLWMMLAHSQGSPLNQSRLASSLAVTPPAIGRYIDLLVDLLLVRRLRPWSGNVGKRLVRTPKTYIRDSGLTHALLDLERWEDVLGHPVAGPSWEGFVIETLIGAAGDRRTPYYYRTEDGSEIDLLFERGGTIEMAIEIKRSTAPSVTKGFRLACDTLKPKAAYLVHGSDETWHAERNVTAVSLADMLARLIES